MRIYCFTLECIEIYYYICIILNKNDMKTTKQNASEKARILLASRTYEELAEGLNPYCYGISSLTGLNHGINNR